MNLFSLRSKRCRCFFVTFAIAAGSFLRPAALRAAPPDPSYDTVLSEYGVGSTEYFTAGTYSLGGATGSCVGTPAVTVRTQTRGDWHAGSQVTYYCVVTGPDRFAAVPMSISYVLYASASGDSTHSRADVEPPSKSTAAAPLRDTATLCWPAT